MAEMKLNLAKIMQTRGYPKHHRWLHCMNSMILTCNKISCYCSYVHKMPLQWNIYTHMFCPTKLCKREISAIHRLKPESSADRTHASLSLCVFQTELCVFQSYAPQHYHWHLSSEVLNTHCEGAVTLSQD